MNISHSQRVLITVFSTVLLVALWVSFAWMNFLRSPIISDDQGVKYTVPSGYSTNSVINDLYLLNILNHPTFFKLLVYLKNDKHELKAGEYLFPKGTTPVSLLTQITTGSGMVYHTFTIVPGWSFRQLRKELLRNTDLQHKSASLSDAELMKRLGHPELKPEGMFFPDTYYFAKGSSDLALLKRAFIMMQDKMNAAWVKRDPNIPFANIYEAMTAASLIEKETNLDAERPIIAGVIVNRLHKGMMLQIDPTVIYAAGANFDGTIHRSDLLSKNEFNTYTHKGLPPTPIAIPSMESLDAALHPQHNDYLYFVATNYNYDGGHQFSTTLAEHYRAIAKGKEKKIHPEFFNNDLVKDYFSKIMTQ